MPSLSFSSSAIRSSPQVGLSCAISRINSRRFFGSCGRPRFRDFHLQTVRNAVRCHLRNVSGLTMTRASRQSRNLENQERIGRFRASPRESLAGRQGLEPRYADPESAVLPLDDLPSSVPFYHRPTARTRGRELKRGSAELSFSRWWRAARFTATKSAS
jgi:hypothetical protein